jgi:hypothetical protein
MKVIPKEKMKQYMKWCQNETSTVVCNCGKIVEVKLTPYFYDEEENDVYFASLCPKCGELIITKE